MEDIVPRTSSPRIIVLRCICIGLSVGVVYSLWVAGIYLVQGPDSLGRYHVTLPSLMGLYLSAGVVGGAIVGSVWRFLHYRIVALLTSILVAAITVGSAGTLMFGRPAGWNGSARFTVSVLTVVFGVACAGSLRRAAIEHALDW